VRDRVVMAAAKAILEPIFEADFLPCSFGFRPKRSAHQALEVVRTTANQGAIWVLDADISDCFGSLAFDAIVSQLERRVSDRKMLKLVRAWLRMGVMEGGVVTDQVAGAPQGSPVSPLIANIVLHVLDEEWARSGQGLGVLVRYCDDFVVLTRSRAAAEEAKARIVSILERLGLRLHPDKTRIVCLAKGQEGFVFLGFEHRLRESKRWRGRWYLQKWPSPRAMASIRARVRQRTALPLASLPLEDVVGHLNSVLRGWGGVLRRGKLLGEVPHRGQLRPSANGQAGQQEARAPRMALGHPLHLRVAHRPGDLPPRRKGALPPGCVCLTVNDVGEPDEWRTSCPRSIGGGWQSRGVSQRRATRLPHHRARHAGSVGRRRVRRRRPSPRRSSWCGRSSRVGRFVSCRVAACGTGGRLRCSARV
jgi:group II intron reverse transcriptase/maturase